MTRSTARRRQAGFTIMEVAFALVIFAMMTVLFAAVFPMTIRGAQYSSNYSQAAMLAQHKMDQIRSNGFLSLNPNIDLGHLQNANIVDAAQAAGYPAAVNGGATYSFTAADSMINDGVTKGYFPPGSQGLVTIADYAMLHPSSGIPAKTLEYITVQIKWTGGGVSDGSYSTSSMLSK